MSFKHKQSESIRRFQILKPFLVDSKIWGSNPTIMNIENRTNIVDKILDYHFQIDGQILYDGKSEYFCSRMQPRDYKTFTIRANRTNKDGSASLEFEMRKMIEDYKEKRNNHWFIQAYFTPDDDLLRFGVIMTHDLIHFCSHNTNLVKEKITGKEYEPNFTVFAVVEWSDLVEYKVPSFQCFELFDKVQAERDMDACKAKAYDKFFGDK
jgi:hypothetical protein